MTDWLATLRAVADRDGKAEAARRIGYSRPAVSLVLSGRYPGDTTKIAAAVLARLGTVACPHQDATIPAVACQRLRTAPMPTANRQAFQQWQACRTCPNNPDGGER